MNSEDNNQDVVADDTGGGEGDEVETVTVPKKDYDKLNQDLGAIKRSYKDLKQSAEKPKETETPISNQKPDDALLQRLEKLALKTAGVTHEDDIELARKTAKKWGMEIEDVLGDEDFKVKLEKQQSSRANVEATSNVRGSNSGQSSSKAKADYWIGKNTPPSDDDVATNKIPREELSKIMGHFVQNKGSNKKFYND